MQPSIVICDQLTRWKNGGMVCAIKYRRRGINVIDEHCWRGQRLIEWLFVKCFSLAFSVDFCCQDKRAVHTSKRRNVVGVWYYGLWYDLSYLEVRMQCHRHQELLVLNLLLWIITNRQHLLSLNIKKIIMIMIIHVLIANLHYGTNTIKSILHCWLKSHTILLPSQPDISPLLFSFLEDVLLHHSASYHTTSQTHFLVPQHVRMATDPIAIRKLMNTPNRRQHMISWS